MELGDGGWDEGTFVGREETRPFQEYPIAGRKIRTDSLYGLFLIIFDIA